MEDKMRYEKLIEAIVDFITEEHSLDLIEYKGGYKFLKKIYSNCQNSGECLKFEGGGWCKRCKGWKPLVLEEK